MVTVRMVREGIQPGKYTVCMMPAVQAQDTETDMVQTGQTRARQEHLDPQAAAAVSTMRLLFAGKILARISTELAGILCMLYSKIRGRHTYRLGALTRLERMHAHILACMHVCGGGLTTLTLCTQVT